MVEQDRKLDAVRNMLQKAVRTTVLIWKDCLSHALPAQDVLRYFRDMDSQHMRYSLRVTFEGEAGVDEEVS